MAYNVKRIDPLDLQPRKAIGVSLPFSGKAVFNSTYQSKDAIKANLINFFLTGQGERYFNPGFGSGLRNLLFSNITQSRISAIKDNIENLLSIYFPRIIINNLELSSEPDTNTVVFFLNYRVSETDIEDEIVINIEQ
jgi:phage baseplate assembly protein W